ncbi:polysaccharide pyruvyl transferase family protein [Sporosarcina ureae]|uniref:polysaccharide pyruvyl transferase family protein n=1 Tax=Sporosarcina ureae TaxID=1571 RepID=UPI0028A5E1C3|nr:polysaccharide pyruvyl transferase family protein [Sporosarcina ureae]
MKCLLVSFFNSGNLGDCLLANELFELVSNNFETERYSYTGPHDIITDINNIKETNSNINQNIKGEIYEKLKKAKLTLPIVLYRKLRKENFNIDPFQKKIQNVDVLVIGGGNMIFDKDKFTNSAMRFNQFVSLGKESNVKIFAISIGIGPFQTVQQAKKAVTALGKCDYITFRDQKSYDIYAKYSSSLDNVFVSVDPVFSLPYVLEKKKNKKLVIGVNIFNSKLIGDSMKEYKRFIDSYIKLINKLTGSLDVTVILFSTDLKDYDSVREVYSHFDENFNVELYEINGYNSLIDLYQNINLLIAARMHSLIIAFTQRVPIIGLSWQQKVDAFFEIIDSKESVFKYNEIEKNIEMIIQLTKTKLINIIIEEEKIEDKLKSINIKRQIDQDILSKLM